MNWLIYLGELVTNWSEKREALAIRIAELFPVRQIYFRTNGVVRFIAIPSWVQIGLLTLIMGAFLWVAMTSFHYLRRDAILEDREQTIRDMAVQVDDISDDMDLLKKSVLERAALLESRQKYLEGILETDPVNPMVTNASIGPELDQDDTPDSNTASDRIPASDDGGFEDNDQTASLLPDVDSLQILASERLADVEAGQERIAQALLERVNTRFAELDAQIAETGINSANLFSNWDGSGTSVAMGGPFVPTLDVSNASLVGEDNSKFMSLAGELNTRWSEMQQAYDAVFSMPSIEPVTDYYISSRFGRRTDPIRKAPSMHYALDMPGAAGAPVMATAPGRITKAGNRYPYGNLVEIDHGNGFKTRYGHLQKVLVNVGDVVDRGQNVGKMGCTGRCTGTHVHYEVWFAGRPRDPLPFMKVQLDILENERQENE